MTLSAKPDRVESNIDRTQIVLLFSGGRDSSLAACLLAHHRHQVHLLTCDEGISIHSDISEYRLKELMTRFPTEIISRTIVPSHGLFRRVALANIESDFQKYQKNLILLGAQLAAHTEGIVYCHEHHISTLGSGYTRYEANFAEQMSEAIELTSAFCSEFGITYVTPVYEYTSLDQVKYRLMDFGISTKSLEGVTVFADTFTDPSPELVTTYINDKLPICRDYLKFRMDR